MRLLSRLLVSLLLLGGAGAALAAAAPQAPATVPAVGETAPPALGVGRDGKQVSLADHRGKIVIVSFWASWCGYCLKELPALEAVQRQTGNEFLQVIAVNALDSHSDYRAMQRQLRKFTLLQARDRDGEVARAYGVKSLPDLWIIGPRGQVAAHHRGYGPESLQAILDDIKRVIVEETSGKTADAATTSP